MTLTLNDIDSNEIYKEAKGSLASRIDYAWQIYIDEQYHEEQRKKALLFLIYAFDIKDSNILNEQLLLLMKERELYKATNPEYIPGKPLGHLPFDPRQVGNVPEVFLDKI